MENLEDKINELKIKYESNLKKLPRGISYSKLIIDLFSGLIVGSALGYLTDHYFNTLPIFLFIFTILGTAGGFYNFMRELNSIISNEEIKDKEDA